MNKIYVITLLALHFLMLGKTPKLIYKENKGQWPDKVLFGSEFLNTQFYINQNSFNYCIRSIADLKKAQEHHHSDIPKIDIIHGHNYEVEFLNGSLSSFDKRQKQEEYFNYFLGNDKRKWASEVKAYKSILFSEVYPNINLDVYSTGLNVKYDFIVKKGGDLTKVQMHYKYTYGVEVKGEELIIETSVGKIREQAPIAYQIIQGKKIAINCKYRLLSENVIGFDCPEGYDKNYELIIDPTVIVCSYSGAQNWTNNYSETYDEDGNIYDLGGAEQGYPTTTGAFQTVSGQYVCVISKYNSTGSARLFSTYLGGDSVEIPINIVVKNNQINIFGKTTSKNFPVTTNAYDTTNNGGKDYFISKLNLIGTNLLASTYVGGQSNEEVSITGSAEISGEMICDDLGNIYVCGGTYSTDFPTTSGTISQTLKGVYDGVVFKLNPNLDNLLWSTFLGGMGKDKCKALRLDGSGGVYCLGATTSTNFPTTSGSYAVSKIGNPFDWDLFITHINATGTSIISSTFLGMTSRDLPDFIDVDLNNDVYVCGTIVNPTNFIATPGIYSNPSGRNVIYKLNSTLSTVLYKTKFGFVTGTVFDDPLLTYSAFKVDSCQKVYVAGFGSNTFPTTNGAFQSFGGGGTDIYMAVFNTNCISLAFASYFGGADALYDTGEHNDGGISYFDNKGYLYQAICTMGGLPITANAYDSGYDQMDTTKTTFNDAILKVDMQTFVNASFSYGANIMGCEPFTAEFNNYSNTGTVSWNFGDGSAMSSESSVSHTYSNLGEYDVVLVVTDTNTCNKVDSVISVLTVVANPQLELGPDKYMCDNNPIAIFSNVSNVSYLWSSGATTPSIIVNQPGKYSLTVNNGGCEVKDEVNVVLSDSDLRDKFPNVITPNNDGANDLIDFEKYNLVEIEFTVFDRWGNVKYKTTEPANQWYPKNLEDGSYFYVMNYTTNCSQEQNKLQGFITIFK